MWNKIYAALVGLIVLLMPAFAGAAEHNHDKNAHAMESILQSYLEIQNSLSNDSISGVSENARKIVAQADQLSKKTPFLNPTDGVCNITHCVFLCGANKLFKYALLR